MVGLRNLDKKKGGDLLVFGGKPGDPRVGIPGKRVGYMPQVRLSNIPRSKWYFHGDFDEFQYQKPLQTSVKVLKVLLFRSLLFMENSALVKLFDILEDFMDWIPRLLN